MQRPGPLEGAEKARADREGLWGWRGARLALRSANASIRKAADTFSFL